MKIVVVGAGAMGCLFSAFLTKSKEDVWLLDKDKDNARKLNETGISVEGVSVSCQVKIKATANKTSALGGCFIYCSKRRLNSFTSSSVIGIGSPSFSTGRFPWAAAHFCFSFDLA